MMSNMELVEKLTLGKDRVETVNITIDGEEDELTLRPLTSGELSKLQTIEKKGFTMKVGINSKGKRESVTTNDVDVDVGEFSKYQTEAMFKAVAWSMSVDGATVKPEQVENFLPGVPEQIFAHVIRISNLNDQDLTIIKTFRKN